MADTSTLRGRPGGGRITVNVAGNANILLTPAQIQAEEIVYTGALTGNITVRLPLTRENEGHSFRINNQSTGAFTIHTAGPSDTGISVPQGRSHVLGWNGFGLASTMESALLHESIVTTLTTTSDLVLTNARWKCGTNLFNGSPGGTVNIIVPPSSGIYFVVNACDVSLVIKPAGGAGIEIATLRAACVFCDGLGVARLTPDVDFQAGLVPP